MMANNEVPAWARPVLEALRDAAGWMRMEVQCEEDARRTAQKQHVAWLDLEARCARALASDAGTPEGEPFFHRLGCPQISGRGTAAHCTCPPDRERPEQTPAANAPEISTALVDAAPDAELEDLLIEFREAVEGSVYAAERGGGFHAHDDDITRTRAAIHAHVARVKQERTT